MPKICTALRALPLVLMLIKRPDNVQIYFFQLLYIFSSGPPPLKPTIIIDNMSALTSEHQAARAGQTVTVKCIRDDDADSRKLVLIREGVTTKENKERNYSTKIK